MEPPLPSEATLTPEGVGSDLRPSRRVGPRGRWLRFRLRRSGLEPAARLLAAAVAIVASHVCGWVADLFAGAERRTARRAARLRRSAERVARALGASRGVFVKAAQFVSLRHDIVPAEASEVLARLQDRVPPLPFPEIRAAVEEAFGAPLESLYRDFEPVPVGAASVAQVHRARLPDGRPVAVKVQYPWIAESLPADLAILRGLIALFAVATGRRLLERDRFFSEFAEGLREELDFEREAQVAQEIAQNLAGDPQIVVPQVIASHTRRSVLTMTYHDAVSVADRPALARLGVEPRAVLEILARAYAKQVFADGLFHADPHPGNLFVLPPEREAPDRAGPRVLFVDFGLSKRLRPELRSEMRRGLYAIVQRDVAEFVTRMEGMGMIAAGARPAVERAVEEMFARIAERGGSGGALAVAGADVLALKDEAKRLLQETPGLQLPNDLLLYAKTLSYLFALGDSLDREVDLVKLSLPYLLRFLAERE